MRRLQTYLLTALLSLLALTVMGQSQSSSYVMAATMLDSLGLSQAVSVITGSVLLIISRRNFR